MRTRENLVNITSEGTTTASEVTAGTLEHGLAHDPDGVHIGARAQHRTLAYWVVAMIIVVGGMVLMLVAVK